MRGDEREHFDDQERLARLALYLGVKLNSASFHRVLNRVGSAAAAFEARDLMLKGVNLTPLLVGGLFEEAEDRLAEARRSGLDIIIWGDDHYPLRLDEIVEPAPVLWVRSQLTATDQYSVALVGSRQASPGGLKAARRLAREGAGMGLTIVSGLAKGVDAEAHRGALESGGRTLAVLGCGLDRVYPKENARLYEEIAQNGALISEFPPETSPLPANFPRRNRVIAGLSLAVVVVEAGQRSGALITARLALEMNREVMALPGPAEAVFAKGANNLIKNGAALVENMGEVLAEIKPRLLEGLTRPEPLSETGLMAHEAQETVGDPVGEATGPPGAGKTARSLDRSTARAAPGSPEEAVLEALDNGPQDADTLGRAAGLDPAGAAVLLLNMEFSGLITRLPSGQYQTS